LRFSVSGDTFVTQVIFLAFSLSRLFADSLTAESLISIFEGGHYEYTTVWSPGAAVN